MILEILGDRFVKLDRDSDKEIYLHLRVPKSDLERRFPWHMLELKEAYQKRLDAAGVTAKVALGRLQAVSYFCVTYGNEVYVARMVEVETEGLGNPIERLVTSVPRTNANGTKRKDARLVIEGSHLARLDLVIGDKLDMFVVDSTPDKSGYIVLTPKKRLK